MDDKFKVYIAGPIAGSGLQLQNVRKALHWADQVWSDGMIPFVPHLYSFWDMLMPKSGDEWLILDFDWLETCQALLRLPGESPGSDKEIAHAISLSIPCFKTEKYFQLLNYFKEWKAANPVTNPAHDCDYQYCTRNGNGIFQGQCGGMGRNMPKPEDMLGYCDQFGGSDEDSHYDRPVPFVPGWPPQTD